MYQCPVSTVMHLQRVGFVSNSHMKQNSTSKSSHKKGAPGKSVAPCLLQYHQPSQQPGSVIADSPSPVRRDLLCVNERDSFAYESESLCLIMFRVLMLRYDHFQNLCLELANWELRLFQLESRSRHAKPITNRYCAWTKPREISGKPREPKLHVWPLETTQESKNKMRHVHNLYNITYIYITYAIWIIHIWLIGAQPSPCRPFAHHLLETLILCSSLSTAHISI